MTFNAALFGFQRLLRDAARRRVGRYASRATGCRLPGRLMRSSHWKRGKPRHQADVSLAKRIGERALPRAIEERRVGSLSVVVFWIWVGLPYPSPYVNVVLGLGHERAIQSCRPLRSRVRWLLAANGNQRRSKFVPAVCEAAVATRSPSSRRSVGLVNTALDVHPGVRKLAVGIIQCDQPVACVLDALCLESLESPPLQVQSRP